MPVVLHGSDARWQLQLSSQGATGPIDVTRQARWDASPSDVIEIDETGMITPLRNGKVMVTASVSQHTASLAVEVIGFDDPKRVNFPNQVVPVFTKLGCNSGGCHGKMAGQNGFKLSLLGFEPTEDFEHLVKETRGRRLFPAAPDESLLLLKAINASPHGGGQKLERNTHEYRLLRRWIEQSMPYGEDSDPVLVSISIWFLEREEWREMPRSSSPFWLSIRTVAMSTSLERCSLNPTMAIWPK